jgi:serine/threonine protein kinase
MKTRQLRRLLAKPILMTPAVRPEPMASGRLPRYRVFIPSDAKDLLVGARVANRYYVLSILGHGGMSVVYKAKLMGKNSRIVALKTLRTQGLNDELIVKRFQREAELLSKLNHPRIVQVYDYGTTLRGQPYFVMDYLTGINLADLLKYQGPLAVEKFRDIFSQVCGAVDHAHRCGVIHRDLKPGNIMLCNFNGQSDFVKVVDFGIARFEEEAQRLTRLGEVWGSPIYMSPEQCMGAPLDARSDIYSIGVVMYEALTGQVPFLGRNYVDTMTQQISSPPRSMSEVRPDLNLPAKVDQIVLRALAKEPDTRYQTMAELRDDIEKSMSRPLKMERSYSGLAAVQQPKNARNLRASAIRQEQRSELKNAVMTVILIVVLVVGVGYGFMRYRETIDKTKKGVESYQLQRSGESNRSNQIQRPSGLNPLDAVPPADNSHR